MRRQQFTQRRGHVVKRFFLAATTLWLVVSPMLLTTVSPSQAEIYRWKDDKGVVRYSNAPPKGERAKLMDVIPTHRVPLVEDADGTVYYLNLPDSKLTQDMSFQDVLDQLSLPADVLDELMEEASVKAKTAEAGPLSTVTFRLAELEQALERETTKRLKWEQEFLKTQSRNKELEQRNEQLQLVLVNMETKIDRVQKAVVVSEAHASALREPHRQVGQLESRIEELQATLLEQNPERDLGQLEGKIAQLQAYLAEMSRQSEEETTELSSTLDKVRETQGLQLASLGGRLDKLEDYGDSQLQARLRGLQATQKQQIGEFETKLRELESIKTTYEQHMQALSDKLGTGELATKLRELESIKTAYEQRMQTFSDKLGMLETSMDDLERSALPAQVNSLMERVAAFEQQPKDEAIYVKLAALETVMATLTDAVPASRNTSTLVAELFESKEYLETMSGRQFEQIRQQQVQIAMLRDEVEQLKVRNNVPQESKQEAPIIKPSLLTVLTEKSIWMEELFQQQASVLALQQERIVAIESTLGQTQLKSDNPARIEEQPQKVPGESSSRISVVERQYRRGAKRQSVLGLYVTR